MGADRSESVGARPKPPLLSPVELEVLRRLTPTEKLRLCCDLSDFTRKLFRIGLRRRYPAISEEELQQRFLEGLQECHNSNY